MNAGFVFVTGAGGFVGREVCRLLRAQGVPVRALVRRADPGLAAEGVETVGGDLRDPAAWRARLAGATAVIHCAAKAAFSGGASAAYEEINVAGTAALLAAVRADAPGLARFVFVSTIGAVDRAPGDACAAPLGSASPLHPTSEYGRSKARAEALVRAAGLPFAIVRPAMVVGAGMRPGSHFAVFVRAALRGAPLARVAWPGRFGVVAAADLAAALVLVATAPAAAGATLFCAGETVAVADCFAAAAPGRSLLPLGWTGPVLRAVPALVPFRLKAMLGAALTADDAPLRALGWTPRIPATAALRDVIVRERARLDPACDPGGQTVITGAASGLGRALAERLAPLRTQVLLVDRDGEGLAAVQARYPHSRTLVADLGNEAAVAAVARSEAWRAFPVSELFACAGLGLRGEVMEHAAERHAAIFKTNVLARLAFSQAAVPGMRERHFGRIVWIASSSAFQPLPGLASYAAANAALLSLGEAWGEELRADGVHLLTVCPGGMRTNFQRTAGVKVVAGETLMPPEDVAEAILRALAQGRRTALVSRRAHAMALLARVLPRAWSVALWARLMRRLR